MPTLRAAALEGLGIVQLPTLLIWPDVQAGRLVHVLPEWRPPAGIIHAVFPSRRGLLPSVRALLDFFAHECALQRGRAAKVLRPHAIRSEEHTSELQSLMRTAYAVFGLQKKKRIT